MNRFDKGRYRSVVVLLSAASLCLVAGCHQQKQSDTGKTYTSSQKTGQGGGTAPGGGSGAQSEAKPLNSPADTANGKSSRASDSGTSDATRGQVVAEPGAPVEHDPTPKPPSSGGSH